MKQQGFYLCFSGLFTSEEASTCFLDAIYILHISIWIICINGTRVKAVSQKFLSEKICTDLNHLNENQSCGP